MLVGSRFVGGLRMNLVSMILLMMIFIHFHFDMSFLPFLSLVFDVRCSSANTFCFVMVCTQGVELYKDVSPLQLFSSFLLLFLTCFLLSTRTLMTKLLTVVLIV
uniref:Uncharacterized protein n=1 Tax=Cacopsylla melanoneura TaxID=428564 RepID=A0A8D8YN86_9HEMI